MYSLHCSFPRARWSFQLLVPFTTFCNLIPKINHMVLSFFVILTLHYSSTISLSPLKSIRPTSLCPFPTRPQNFTPARALFFFHHTHQQFSRLRSGGLKHRSNGDTEPIGFAIGMTESSHMEIGFALMTRFINPLSSSQSPSSSSDLDVAAAFECRSQLRQRSTFDPYSIASETLSNCHHTRFALL